MPILTGCGRRVRCLLSMCWKTRCFCEVKYLVVVLPVTDADYRSDGVTLMGGVTLMI